MLNQTFGVEIEMSGITREAAANIIANYFGTSSRYDGEGYSTWSAGDLMGRRWKCVYDSSIRAHDNEHKCELVTPILTYSDMPALQEIVRLLKRAGAISSPEYKCGIHVHIGAFDHTVRSLKNLINFMSSYQDIIYRAVDVNTSRECYCQKTEPSLIERFNKVKTRDDCERAWYGTRDTAYRKHQHYDSSRYHGLNFHSLFSKGTLEFRVFNGTLHAGKIRAYVVMCLAISNYAKTKKYITKNKKQQFNDKYTMYEMLCKIGVKGEEFKACRDHLVSNLSGGLGHDARYQ